MSTGNDGLISRVAQQGELHDALAGLASGGGGSRVVTLQGAEGSGRRTLIEATLAALPAGSRPLLPIRARFGEGEDSLRILLRLYAALYTSIAGDDDLKARVSSLVEAKLGDESLAEQDPMRLWLKAFQEGMEKELPDPEAPTFQVTVPRASPYLGLMRILDLLGEEFALLVEIGDAQNVLSFAFWTFLLSAATRAHRAGTPAAFILWHAPAPEGDDLEPLRRVSQLEGCLSELPEGIETTRIELGPLSADELAALVAARHPGMDLPAGFLDQLLERSGGLPGPAVQILDRLAAQQRLRINGDGQWHLDVDAAALSPQSLLPALPDGDESKLRRALQIGALEGRVFTSAVVAEALELKQDEVDDLLDELDEHLEEVVFHQGMNTWLYRFQSPLFQAAVLEGLDPRARQEQARQLATLLERRYVTRSRDYAIKSARLWQEAGEIPRALRLMGLAISMERPEVLQMGFEILHVDAETAFPKPIVRGLLLSLLEKLAASGNPGVGLQVVDKLDAWIAASGADELKPWADQYRARFMLRQGKASEAASLAEDARKAFARAGNDIKQGETLALLAQIELGRNEPGKALEAAKRAISLTDFPPVQAQARFTKGLIHKLRGELQPAVDELRQALELSARTGMFPLHADSGLNLAETLLMGNNPSAALGLLDQLLAFTRQNQMQPRERGVLSLLGKAHAALQDFTQATNMASDALKVARAMKNRLAEAADLFDLGLYSYLRKQFDEAQIYLKEAEHAAAELKHPPLLTEIHFHQGLVASALGDLTKARTAYAAAEPFCREVGNQRRLTNILFNLGALYLHAEELDKARRYLDEAQPLVEQYGSDADKKGMRRALSQLDDKLH